MGNSNSGIGIDSRITIISSCFGIGIGIKLLRNAGIGIGIKIAWNRNQLKNGIGSTTIDMIDLKTSGIGIETGMRGIGIGIIYFSACWNWNGNWKQKIVWNWNRESLESPTLKPTQ